MLLSERIALVTGAGSGIGEATALAFARHGARVIAVDIDGASASTTVEAIRAAGGDAIARTADASRSDELEALFGYVEREHGRLDVLHNNHVWAENGTLADVTLDGFRRSLEVGVTSYFYATKLAIPLMLAHGGGAIVNTASVCGLAGDFGIGPYNVLKAAVVNLSRATALDYAKQGIRCNAICPGPTATRPYARVLETNPELLAKTCDAVPMGRFADPAEIADCVVFLASDMASFVTGHALVVDGGLLAWTGLPPVSGVIDGLD